MRLFGLEITTARRAFDLRKKEYDEGWGDGHQIGVESTEDRLRLDRIQANKHLTNMVRFDRSFPPHSDCLTIMFSPLFRELGRSNDKPYADFVIDQTVRALRAIFESYRQR